VGGGTHFVYGVNRRHRFVVTPSIYRVFADLTEGGQRFTSLGILNAMYQCGVITQEHRQSQQDLTMSYLMQIDPKPDSNEYGPYRLARRKAMPKNTCRSAPAGTQSYSKALQIRYLETLVTWARTGPDKFELVLKDHGMVTVNGACFLDPAKYPCRGVPGTEHLDARPCVANGTCRHTVRVGAVLMQRLANAVGSEPDAIPMDKPLHNLFVCAECFNTNV